VWALVQGWEERIDASMTHLLRTSLAKTAKDVAGVPPPLAMSPDTTKLKKHITYVCDRLSKGALLVRSKKAGAAAKAVPAGADPEDDDEDD
jgi:Bardet-Biedl syndrome 9 protein